MPQIQNGQRKVSVLLDERKELLEKIQKLEMFGDVNISIHAILRYFERVVGLDIKEIEEKILPDNIRDLVAELGDGKYQNGDFTVVVKNGVVATVYK